MRTELPQAIVAALKESIVVVLKPHPQHVGPSSAGNSIMFTNFSHTTETVGSKSTSHSREGVIKKSTI